jgi:hypothetical protein
MTEPANPFTPDEIELFHSEGWDVFEASGSSQNDSGDRPFQLQRLDEEAILSDDVEAWKLVWRKAGEGSAPHAKALDFLNQHSPAEYAAILEECQPH